MQITLHFSDEAHLEHFCPHDGNPSHTDMVCGNGLITKVLLPCQGNHKENAFTYEGECEEYESRVVVRLKNHIEQICRTGIPKRYIASVERNSDTPQVVTT